MNLWFLLQFFVSLTILYVAHNSFPLCNSHTVPYFFHSFPFSPTIPHSLTVPRSSHISPFSPTILFLLQFFHSSLFIPTIPHSLLQFSIHSHKSLSLPHFSICSRDSLVFPTIFSLAKCLTSPTDFVSLTILPQFLVFPQFYVLSHNSLFPTIPCFFHNSLFSKFFQTQFLFLLEFSVLSHNCPLSPTIICHY